MMKFILAFILLIPLTLNAAILYVALDGTQAYGDIQSAVNSAADQDTILIHPGTYYENIEILSRQLTIASMELITSDSTFIAQTVIDGNQSGSCIYIDQDALVTIQGLYLTNGIGSMWIPGRGRKGGAICAVYSDISIINCRVINNRAMSGAGIYLMYGSGYLAGTTIAHNWGKHTGALSYFGRYLDPETTIEFDPVNRCSIYNNHAGYSNDMSIIIRERTHIDVYLDKFTVPQSSAYFRECVKIIPEHDYTEFTFTFHYNETVLTQQYADFFVSPDGDDANTGLSQEDPLKTIALALHRIGADAQRPHTIHLANGIYAEDQHFPLNIRSYVNIVGESEEGVIFSGPDMFILGRDAEKEVTLKNITFQAITDEGFYLTVLIDCTCGHAINGVYERPVLTLENLSFRNCQPLHYDSMYKLIEIIFPGKLVLRNITVEDCIGSVAIHTWGGNIYAENIRINNFHAPPNGEPGGCALNIALSHPDGTCGAIIINNMQITGCQAHLGDQSSIINIRSTFVPAVINTYFINSTITDNQWSTGHGAAITLGTNAKVSFINSIISTEAGMNFMLRNEDIPSNLQFLNCLVGPSDNPEDTVYNMGQNNTIEWYGTNLSSDPGFYAWEEGSPYTLGEDSPCIDAGTTDLSIFDLPDWYQFPSSDLAGDPRIYGDQVDLGAYEWQGQTDNEDLLAAPAFSMTNYPNPFNPETTISFFLPETEPLTISIFNLKGQKVSALFSGILNSGNHNFVWNGTDSNGRPMSSGIYFARIENDKQTRTHKMMLIK